MSLIPALVMSAAALAGPVLPPTQAVAAGMAAYDRGDFTTALAILKPIVYDATLDLRPSSDPWAAAYLAQMFRRGEGTAPDWPLSCALFNDASASTPWWEYGPGSAGPPIPFLAEGIKEVCLPQTEQEVAALRSSCFLDGVTRREFVLDGGAWLVVDRRGFHLDLAGEHRDRGLSMMCHEVMVSLTEADVSLPYGSSHQRAHFLELFKWKMGIDGNRPGHIIRQLHWIVYEVRGADLAPATDQIVLTVIDGPYPSTDMPPGIRDAAVLRLNAAGDIEWRLKVPPAKRGIIGKPE